MSQLFASGGQSTRASASASVLPMNTHLLQDGLVGSPCSPRGSDGALEQCTQTPWDDRVLTVLTTLCPSGRQCSIQCPTVVSALAVCVGMLVRFHNGKLQ